MTEFKGQSTISVHSGEHLDRETGSVNTPIYQSSTFFFPTGDKRTWDGEVPDGSYIYTRYGNPTVSAAERKIAALESGKHCLLFASGMAATSTTLLTYLKAGDRLVSQEDIYGGSYNLMRYHLTSLGIDVSFAPTADTGALIEAIVPGTKLVWLESPTNPLLKLVDYPEVIKAAHERGAMVSFEDNAAVITTEEGETKGTDIKGPVAREAAERWPRIAATASTII